MDGAVTKAVIPAAGLGTRFLPASKAIPKEMIPVVDRPAIQYVVEEAVAAGITDVCLITAEGKEAIAAHFDAAPALEAVLEAKGDDARLASVRHAAALAHMTYVYQDAPRGLGHAIACAEQFVAGEPFAVLLGDDFLDADDYVLDTMCEVQRRTGGTVLLLLEVPPHLTPLYGVVDPSPIDALALSGTGELPDGIELYSISRLHEKPSQEDAYSNLIVIGRYVFPPQVFDVLRHTPAGRGGEIQITDAIHTLAGMSHEQGGGVYGIVFRGARYDTGDRLEYLKSTVQLAAKHPQVGPEFLQWLHGFVAGNDNH